MIRFWFVAALLVLAGCASEPGTARVTGTVVYRGGTEFPAGATVRVKLRDAAPLEGSSTIAEQVVVTAARVSAVECALEYDPRRIDPDHDYSVSAEVQVDGELHFVSRSSTAVLTRGHAARADIVVDAVWRHRFRPDLSAPPGSSLFVGAFTYMADAGWFTYCDTGVRQPVAQKGDNAALERAYGGADHEPGGPVVVTFLGHLEPMQSMEGPPLDHVIVDRFHRVWPGETCAKVGVETPLANTYWKLVELGGAPVVTPEGGREIHLTLRTDGETVDGFSGCNRFSGRYEHVSWNLRFRQVAATLMACPDMREEQAFLEALDRTSHYQIVGESLDLLDDDGLRARFRAVYLR